MCPATSNDANTDNADPSNPSSAQPIGALICEAIDVGYTAP
jgi:hypothetical protein